MRSQRDTSWLLPYYSHCVLSGPLLGFRSDQATYYRRRKTDAEQHTESKIVEGRHERRKPQASGIARSTSVARCCSSADHCKADAGVLLLRLVSKCASCVVFSTEPLNSRAPAKCRQTRFGVVQKENHQSRFEVGLELPSRV